MAAIERFIRTVTFAVRLQDDFSGQDLLVGSTRVFLKGRGVAAIENLSRYYVFVDLSGTTFTVHVENQFYFDQEVAVKISDLDGRNPVVAITMKPAYRYPFPEASTLIRGAVIGPGGNPVTGAAVSVVDGSPVNSSEPDGRFVLYFRPLTEDDIAIAGTHRLVRVGTGSALQIKVEHPLYAPKTVTVGDVEEGATALLSAPIALEP